MSFALLLLILGVLSAAVAVVFNGAMRNDPAPSMSGSFIPVMFFAAVAAVLLLLSLFTWIVSVTMAVL